MSKQTIWREGERICRTDGSGYGDIVSDETIRGHIALHTVEPADRVFVAFAEAVLAIRAFERLTACLNCCCNDEEEGR